MINTAIEICTPEQRAILDANYGRKDPEAEKRVKVVFKELELEDRFKAYEKKSYEEIMGLVEGIDESKGLKKEIFEEFLKKVYKRTK